ncbi:hypothetical protein AB1N83_003317 [Pleurotus pulmonarius]
MAVVPTDDGVRSEEMSFSRLDEYPIRQLRSVNPIPSAKVQVPWYRRQTNTGWVIAAITVLRWLCCLQDAPSRLQARRPRARTPAFIERPTIYNKN